MSGIAWLLVCVGAGCGSTARYVTDQWVQSRWNHRPRGRFPLGILLINVAGSFVLGILVGGGTGGNGLLLAGTATIGSFTTFSTWMLETERLAEDGDDRLALLNIVVSLAAGLAAALAGWAIARAL